ncbi:MAG: AraC family transcriptional regulator [Clostridia bacterium]|nr:AraC family transcriptional regulator [Clostridia bacterium]
MQSELLSNVNPIYYKGDLSLCDHNWHYERIVAGCDQLYYIIEGECVIEVNGIRHTATPGQLFFLPSHSTRTLYTENGKTVRKYWLHCSLPCGEKTFFDLINLPFFIEVADPELVESLFKSILAKGTDVSLMGKLEQKADILRLLAYYIHSSGASRASVAHDGKISYIIGYIEKNLTQPLTLESLSEMLHFNPSYFIRYFKAETGFTPMSYINHQRVLLAQRLLLDAKIPVQDVGVRAGFPNPYYFSRYFKKKTGFSPTEYRSYAVRTYKTK